MARPRCGPAGSTNPLFSAKSASDETMANKSTGVRF